MKDIFVSNVEKKDFKSIKFTIDFVMALEGKYFTGAFHKMKDDKGNDYIAAICFDKPSLSFLRINTVTGEVKQYGSKT